MLEIKNDALIIPIDILSKMENMKKTYFFVFTALASLAVLIIFVLSSFNDNKLYFVMSDVG